MAYEIVVIGTSWGGLQAMRRVLGTLPAGFDVPVVLVQHRHRDSDALLAMLLQEQTPLTVQEAEDKTELQPGHVYVAPADYHLLIEKGHLTLSTEEPVHFSRPSIDVTMESAADAYGSAIVGVVMTGANDDGSRGLKRIADRGGHAVVQDPKTADSRVMPAAAIRAVPGADVVPLDELGSFLGKLVMRGTSRPAGKPTRNRQGGASTSAPRPGEHRHDVDARRDRDGSMPS